jgi:tRNA(fMet)-specific endonuclease VapC
VEVRVLLDTNAYSDLKRGQASIAEIVRRARRVLFSPVVVGELMYGFRRGRHQQRNVAELIRFLESPFVDLVPVGLTTADRYGRISTGLRDKGRPIPTNDIWIAAQAMETGAELLSSDAHFGEIDGLAWVKPGA